MQSIRQTISLSWGVVSYLEWGRRPSATPTVVLLHGAGFDNASLSWAPLGDALSEAGYHVLAPDHPGYGQTLTPPWPVTQERLVVYVGEFIEALGLENYVIGGLSLGGGLTIGHLLTHPRGARAAMLFGSYGLMDRLSTGPLAALSHWCAWALVHSGWQKRMMLASVQTPRLIRASMGSLIRNPSQITESLIADIVAAGQQPGSMTAYEEWQRDQASPTRLRTNYMLHLSTITLPVLLIHGERDPGVPVRYAREAASQLPSSELHIIPNAAHWVQRDRPDLVFPLVQEFLRRID